jgi:ADP-heptose:LPS heptosyltransferase
MMTPHSKKKFATLRKWNRKKNYFIKTLRMRLAKLAWDYRVRKPFSHQNLHKVLLLRDDDKIGDMVVSTSLIRDLAKNGYKVDVLATPMNLSVIRYNPHVRKIHLTSSPNIITDLKSENYDLVIDMGDKISPRSLKFLRHIQGKNVIGFNKQQYNIYNKSIVYSGYESHITERYAVLMRSMNLSNFSTNYDLHYPESLAQEADTFLKGLGYEKFILINPFAADSRRELSSMQLNEVLSSLRSLYPETAIIVLDHLSRIELELPTGVFINPFNTIPSVTALISQVDLVISPDTSIVHIAATFNKPLIALYGNDLHGEYVNSDVWAPGYDNAIQLRTEDKYHPVSTIAVTTIVEAVREMSKGILIK